MPQAERETVVPSMLQSLLAERFKLTLHHETKEMPVYVLLVAKNGPKMHESDPAPSDGPAPGGPAPGPNRRGSIMMQGRGQLTVNGQPLSRFVDILSRFLGRVVVDQTGLKADYDFKLQWTPGDEEVMFRGMGPGPDGRPAPPPDASGPTLFTALQEQLGLKLESQKAPVDTLVIDHVDKPSEN